ncbi:MAG: hypothetical protein Q4D57_00520 [Clostridia bacterium]|nr:hypothetical protein [Clostridia bacterium]
MSWSNATEEILLFHGAVPLYSSKYFEGSISGHGKCRVGDPKKSLWLYGMAY